jgi:hypothetical protein
MKTHFLISAEEIGKTVQIRRKIVKELSGSYTL